MLCRGAIVRRSHLTWRKDMGLFSRKPKPGDLVRCRMTTGDEYYGVVVTPDIIACAGDDQVYEWILLMFDRVEKVSDDVVPRRKMRQLLRHMGVVPQEEVIGGPASEDELDLRWEIFQGLRASQDAV